MLLVLERCDMNLRQWLLGQQNQALGTRGRAWVVKALGVFLNVARNIQQIHGHHIAHCDVKVREMGVSVQDRSPCQNLEG